MTHHQDLIDYAILPQSQIQQYEDTITQQCDEIKKWKDIAPSLDVKQPESTSEPENEVVIENTVSDVSPDVGVSAEAVKDDVVQKTTTPEVKEKDPPKHAELATIKKGAPVSSWRKLS